MSFITGRNSESIYLGKLRAFLEAAGENRGVLGLDDAALAALQAEIDALGAELQAVGAARAALTAAATAKDERLARVRGIVGGYAAAWRADEAVPDPVLDELMVAPHAVRRRVSRPSVVNDLVLTSTGGGLITLRWGSGGNIKGTVYQIEVCSSPDGHWVLIDTVTARKFVREFSPGVPVWFRVKAKRGSRVSYACNPVSIWTGGATGVRGSGIGDRAAA